MLQMSLEDIETRNLVLLAPFYVLKYRQAVKRSSDNGKRRVLAAEMGELLGKLEALIERAADRGIITVYDGTTLFERLVQMYSDLYTSYPEFEEVTVQLEDRVKTHWQDYFHRGIQEGKQEGRQEGRREGKLEKRSRILALLKQGCTPEQLETLLTQDSNPALNP
jgi:hypothetical protein